MTAVESPLTADGSNGGTSLYPSTTSSSSSPSSPSSSSSSSRPSASSTSLLPPPPPFHCPGSISPPGRGPRAAVAYFCMEYGVDDRLPLYSGGLGILAGDFMKTSQDQDLPLYGIGLFWNEGYVEQRVCGGTVVDNFPETPRSALVPVAKEITVQLEGNDVPLRAFQLESCPKLFLLEPLLSAHRRRYSQRLYQKGEAGDRSRVCQEILLGVGGVRLLRALGLHVDLYHFNEGHAVFAGLELIREKLAGEGRGVLSFLEAWKATRKEIVFTTHTPVAAGNEEHPIEVLMKSSANLGLSVQQLTAIGGSPFNMTVAGLRLSYITNAVSELHGNTARNMWKDVLGSSRIVSITNGVHRGSWQNAEIFQLCQAVEKEEGAVAAATTTMKAAEETIKERVGERWRAFWEGHQLAKQQLLDEIEIRKGVRLNLSKLLIGFARRAATYKRHSLLFRDVSGLDPFLRSGRLQVVFSGKAHPDDEGGRDEIRRLLEMQREYPNSVVYLDNYDMRMGRFLTSGCDVWMNNPVKPQEASGTSGMKAAMNGVLNLSIPDGWWPEGCQNGINGWKVGKEGDGPSSDEEDALALTQTVLEEVLPTYYKKHAKWLEMMRQSIDMASEKFSSNRMVREYYQLLYSLPFAPFPSPAEEEEVDGKKATGKTLAEPPVEEVPAKRVRRSVEQ